MENWYRFLGVRSRETKTVWLFFLHNFLLGIGTILVYVAANAILLEKDPERNLPVAYVAGALAMMVVGNIYTYFEHHLLLRQLAVRVLLAVVVLTAVIGALVLWGHSVAAAVAIMTGYRLIYLLANLEFWGVSAVVFDVRQGRRLFSIISSGDMPAKALGAVLAIFVHDPAHLSFLLVTAFGAYLAALYTLRYTFKSHVVEVRPDPVRIRRHVQPPLIRQLFGGSQLVLSMGLSLTAIAAVAAGVEYFFFVNVKHKLGGQALQYVGAVLALTYLMAMLFKLLLSRHGLDRLGIRWTLAVLPLTALAGMLLFGVLKVLNTGTGGILVYFCGLYLVMEVIRRAVFEPVFLVLFQPLMPQERLKGHTVAKGFYEPLGFALAGVLLFALHRAPALNQWAPFVWMGLFLVGALVALKHTYLQYLVELGTALSRRFGDDTRLALPQTARQLVIKYLRSPSPEEVLTAIEYLQKDSSTALNDHADALLNHPDGRVRRRALAAVGDHMQAPLLRQLVAQDPDALLREMASRLLGRHPEASDLLRHDDLAVRRGAIRGRLEAAATDDDALDSLHSLLTAADTDHRLAALGLIRFLTPAQQAALVQACLESPEPDLVQAAIKAAGETCHPELVGLLLTLLQGKSARKPAADSLVKCGAEAIPQIEEALRHTHDPAFAGRLIQVCGRLALPASRQLLVEVARQPNLRRRSAALRALSSFEAAPTDAPLFQHLLEEEKKLAQWLLHGKQNASADLRSGLNYELTRVQQRFFGILAQLYDHQPIIDAQRGVAHAAREKQANALEILDNLIPRHAYRALQALLEVGPLHEKVFTFDDLLGPFKETAPVLTTIIQRGETTFSAWTISQALRQWQPESDTVALLYPYLDSDNTLIQETATEALERFLGHQPSDNQDVITLCPTLTASVMSHKASNFRVPALDRVLMLKGTALFAQTPENVLSNIVPIMKEVCFHEGEEIFAKNDLGHSLFIVYEGEVGIYSGKQHLTTFRKGECFGELALLDAEPRSASAVALTHVVAFRLDQEDFYDVMDECAEVLRNIVRLLCQRLRKQNEKMQTQE